MVMEHRVSRLEGAFEELSERLGDVLTELRRMNDRIDETQAENNRRFDAMNARLDETQAENNRRFDAMNARLDAQQADTNERFDRQQAETARLIAEQGDRFEQLLKEQQAETARLFTEQNERLDRMDDRIDRHHAENTQRIDAQNRLIVAVTGLALTAAGVVIGLVAAGVV